MSKRQSSAAPSQPGVLTQTISLPQPSQTEDPATDQPLSFWERIAAVPEDEWWSGTMGDKGWKVYLYEDRPGSPYLAVIAHAFDIEWVRQEYGGGAYRAMLNDPSGRMVSHQKFTIDGEPRKKPPQSATVAAPQSAQNDPMLAMVEMIREEQRATREMLRDIMTRDQRPVTNSSGEQQLTLAVLPTVLGGVVKVFESMMPRQQSNTLDDLIKFKQLMGEPRDVLSELARLKEFGLISGAGAGGGDILAQLEVVSKVAERLGFSAGGGGKSITELIVEKGPELLKAFQQGISEYRQLEEKRLETAKYLAAAQRQPVPAQQPAQPQPIPAGAVVPTRQPAQAQPGPQPQFTPATSPTPTPLTVEPIGADAAGQSIPIPPGATGQEVVEAMTQPQLTEAQLNVIKQKVAQSIVNGVSGEDIVGWLAVEAPVVLNGFVGYPVAQVEMFFKSDPILGQAAASPNFKTALKEMVDLLNDTSEGTDQQLS